MKTSNVKPMFSPEQAGQLPSIAEEAIPGSFTQLTEGHFSQVFSYETAAGEQRVLRLGRKEYSFYADRFAHDRYNSDKVPIPQVLEIGQLEPELFYCKSMRIPGVPSDQLSAEDFALARQDMEQVFANIFKTDVSETEGVGRINFSTGNGVRMTYQQFLQKKMSLRDPEYLKDQCAKHIIDPSLVDAAIYQFEDNLPQAEAQTRLIHGDLGGDNVIVQDNKVTGVIDWSAIGLGDWLHDYNRIEFWYPGRHTKATEFAEKYGLETNNFEARWLTHMAEHSISALDFAFRYESQSVIGWLRQNLAVRLDTKSAEVN